MKAVNYLIITLTVIAVATSCSNPKKELATTIANAEKQVYVAQSLDKVKGMDLIKLYVDYSKQYPDDTASANYLYKAAELAMNLQMANQAIGYYDTILAKYRAFDKLAECLFLKAFIYENHLNNLAKAEACYRQFIHDYPTHQLVKDAEASLRYLGKSPEELVRMFQEQNAN